MKKLKKKKKLMDQLFKLSKTKWTIPVTLNLINY